MAIVPNGAERLEYARFSACGVFHKMFKSPEMTPRRNLLAAQIDYTLLRTCFREDLLCSQRCSRPLEKSVTNMLLVTPHNSTARNARSGMHMAGTKFEYLKVALAHSGSTASQSDCSHPGRDRSDYYTRKRNER